MDGRKDITVLRRIELKFEIEPKPKRRTRAGIFIDRLGRKKAMVFNGPKARKDEQDFLVLACCDPRRPEKPIKGPVWISVRAYFTRPKSVRRIHHTVKPDLDNLDKFVLDCLTRAQYWLDDRQVTRKWTTKDYARPGRAKQDKARFYFWAGGNKIPRARPGWAGLGVAWRGMAWLGKARRGFIFGPGKRISQGTASPGKARHGLARQGRARQSRTRRGFLFRPGEANFPRLGESRLGAAGLGTAWRGIARRGNPGPFGAPGI
ncbi:MAG: RusA family crossover junction endodeoxyribonuclease [Deltaproteobacteria bacterium]|jgi:Holliday junction resolvase RusA-like endonuclease|nr:RusA family crossover junction endodeoxyribonuclease [Deltaproteobacteria bacterium]